MPTQATRSAIQHFTAFTYCEIAQIIQYYVKLTTNKTKTIKKSQENLSQRIKVYIKKQQKYYEC
jgi:hypothetical protein